MTSPLPKGGGGLNSKQRNVMKKTRLDTAIENFKQYKSAKKEQASIAAKQFKAAKKKGVAPGMFDPNKYDNWLFPSNKPAQ